MSRFMQIRIHLEAFYRPELRAHFPRLARALEELGIEVDTRRITLYGLIRELERALYGNPRPALRATLERFRPRLVPLRNAVEERLAAWRLEGLDELLYRIEDAFEELEADLD